MSDERIAPGTYVKGEDENGTVREGIVVGFDESDTTYLILFRQTEQDEQSSGMFGWTYSWSDKGVTTPNPQPSIRFPAATDDPEHVFIVEDQSAEGLNAYSDLEHVREDWGAKDIRAAAMEAVADPGVPQEFDRENGSGMFLHFVPVRGAER